MLSKDKICAYLQTKQYHITVEDSLSSTNTVLKEWARNGAPEGTVLIADTQTAGRGRMGRSFFSPSGSGIYMSILLRPTLPLSTVVGRITPCAGLAVHRAIKRVAGIETDIKWVNDLLADGKKLCGILAEADSVEGDMAVVIGIGINVKESAFPEELADIVTSLERLGSTPDRNSLIAAILDELAALSPERPEEWLAEYKAHSAVLGKRVTVLPFGEEPFEARAIDITSDGTLLVEQDGKQIEIGSGEVSLRLGGKE